MRFCLALFVCLSSFAAAETPAELSKTIEAAPIRFEPNSGLHPDSIRWIARGQGYAFAFTEGATVLRVAGRSVRLTFPGSNHAAEFRGEQQQSVSTNYFVEAKRLSVPAYSRLRESAVYRGIDVAYYGNGGQLEYDFEIAPGADPSQIRMRFDGADSVRLNDRGEIVLKLGDGEMTQRAPVVYQRKASGEVATVAAFYRIGKDGTVRLVLANYDAKAPLIVDPVITYSAYLSGSAAEMGIVITHDSKGILYLAGNTESLDFPQSPDAYQPVSGGNKDIWLMKLDPKAGGSAIVYSTYLGGAADDEVHAMTIDQNGVFYVTGATVSGAFPVTSGALISTTSGNTHGFVSMVDPAQGTSGLIYSTYLGGANNDEGDGIAVAKGLIYVTGATTSDNFPVTATTVQAARSVTLDAYVAVIDPTQSGTASEVFGTYLGGSGADSGRTIAVDSAGIVYVAGSTYSFDFPLTTNAYQSGNHDGGDGFLTLIDITKGALVYSTYLGGSSTDEIKKIVIDPAGKVAMTGYTLSYDFPTTQNAYQPVFGGTANAFLAILDLKANNLTTGVGLTYSTFYGGTGGEVAYDLKRDSAGRYYICGYTLSQDLPVTADAISTKSGAQGVDGFIAIIDPTAGSKGLFYSTYITSDGFQVVYGVDVDAAGTVYATGFTTSNILPSGYATNPSVGKYSVFVMSFIPAGVTPAASMHEAHGPASEKAASASPRRQN